MIIFFIPISEVDQDKADKNIRNRRGENEVFHT